MPSWRSSLATIGTSAPSSCREPRTSAMSASDRTNETATKSTPCARPKRRSSRRSEEHTSELQSPCNLVCRLLLEKKKSIYAGMSRSHYACKLLQAVLHQCKQIRGLDLQMVRGDDRLVCLQHDQHLSHMFLGRGIDC